ncbi:MAG: prepilin-type N-terminal cleavage/methylation domain-containing protein [Massilia sp.]|nr:prepilin-type N-terminal cleavage/methylation domain-containing protein [Massilia sp.]
MQHTIYQQRRRRGGFTLIELVIAMTVVLILASVALPAYSGYVARARRADARTQLMQVNQFMQRFYAANDSFEQDRAGNAIVDRIPANLKQSPADGDKLYALAIPAATLNGAGYEIRMVPVAGAGMENDPCGTFTLTSTGVRGVVGGTGAGSSRDTCWK